MVVADGGSGTLRVRWVSDAGKSVRAPLGIGRCWMYKSFRERQGTGVAQDAARGWEGERTKA